MNNKEITLGFSRCPNDCFIFDALVNKKIDTEGLNFKFFIEDVEALNRRALKGELDVTKLSYHAFLYVSKFYQLLHSGSALGNSCGPLLISKKYNKSRFAQQQNLKVGIPGKYTTANFLYTLAYPHHNNKQEMLFSDIEKELLTENIDAGVIIHENRFTYENKGLTKIVDLGEYWEQTTQMPIPLGGIVIHKKFDSKLKAKIDNLIFQSVQYAFDNPKSGLNYIREHAQEMDEEVMYKHIHLYVNDYTLHLGEKGRKTIFTFFEKAKTLNLIPLVPQDIFIDN